MSFVSKCDLHIPYKHATEDWQHDENYKEIERWAQRFRRECLPAGGGGGIAAAVHSDNWTSTFTGDGGGALFSIDDVVLSETSDVVVTANVYSTNISDGEQIGIEPRHSGPSSLTDPPVVYTVAKDNTFSEMHAFIERTWTYMAVPAGTWDFQFYGYCNGTIDYASMHVRVFSAA